jgi:hypothetical protein
VAASAGTACVSRTTCRAPLARQEADQLAGEEHGRCAWRLRLERGAQRGAAKVDQVHAGLGDDAARQPAGSRSADRGASRAGQGDSDFRSRWERGEPEASGQCDSPRRLPRPVRLEALGNGDRQPRPAGLGAADRAVRRAGHRDGDFRPCTVRRDSEARAISRSAVPTRRGPARGARAIRGPAVDEERGRPATPARRGSPIGPHGGRRSAIPPGGAAPPGGSRRRARARRAFRASRPRPSGAAAGRSVRRRGR